MILWILVKFTRENKGHVTGKITTCEINRWKDAHSSGEVHIPSKRNLGEHKILSVTDEEHKQHNDVYMKFKCSLTKQCVFKETHLHGKYKEKQRNDKHTLKVVFTWGTGNGMGLVRDSHHEVCCDLAMQVSVVLMFFVSYLIFYKYVFYWLDI